MSVHCAHSLPWDDNLRLKKLRGFGLFQKIKTSTSHRFVARVSEAEIKAAD